MKTIQATTKAWLMKHHGPQDLERPAGAVVGNVLTYSDADMTSVGWVYVGEATISVTVADERQLVANKVAALRQEQKMERAEAAMKEQRIEQQIQNLLAIEFTPAEVSA